MHLPSVEYTLTGCPSGGSGTTYMMQVQCTRDGALYGFGNDYGSGLTFTPRYSDVMQITIRILGGYACPTGGLRFYPMLRPSSITDATYAPYNGSLVTIDFGGTVYGGTLEYKGGKEWEFTATHAVVDMGELNWSKGTLFASSDIASTVKRPPTNETLADIACSIFDPSARSYVTNNDNKVSIQVDGVIVISASGYADAPTFKTAVTGQKLLYELAQALDPITLYADADTVTEYGDNVLFCSCGDSSLTYRQDIGLVIGG